MVVEHTAVGIALTDSETAAMQEQSTRADAASSRGRIQFETQLPNFNYSAVLQVYRQSLDAPLHAVGGQIWCGPQKQADITPIHYIKLTPWQVEIYLERLLTKPTEVYGICKFTTKEELHPQRS